MTTMTKKNTFRPGEFKARLPYLDKIPTHTLQGRLELGVKRSLAIATASANSLGALAYEKGGDALQEYKADSRSLIAACNYSASQVAKELKARGVAVPK